MSFNSFKKFGKRKLRLKDAPIVSVSLSKSPSKGGPTKYNCEANLLSGSSSSFSIPDEPRRARLEDLAEKVVEELFNNTEASSSKRVFIVLQTDAGDSIPTTVWDWNRELSHFLATGR
mmetsp:Transcript_90623/g.189519  ORF Transcript_90623/g.189519 Transcript_90623/m.189519 type:complete len:118 (+) Transcript_90623:71-424(+)|eukprot:CAMPEP_0194751858 /NCGR_PEP_ID=MMETSP0323_2-20130528/5787_1 /TAXON_ID=2866 ORGANISM="Crypthecodinium cohnii, Strain Seligo" /NCGR_SAMPLE_ID=MMETSP0323_2 /ASSEMBLY_ACC=CAM_ASM_000346 /LENGTH=117 /DNA_ID=CAMNT_0039668511 /DNA_START=57 /DNA_END=410 /DNA_ORIENTATION=-